MRKFEMELFTIDELEEATQKKVIEECRESGIVEHVDNLQFVREQFEQRLEEEGYPLDVEFSLSHCQGDGVAFYGNLNMIAWLEKNKHRLGCHEERARHLIIDEGLEVEITRNSCGHRYAHYNTMDIEVEITGANEYTYANETEEKLNEQLDEGTEDFIYALIKGDVKLISLELERQGYAELEYRQTDEYIKEYIQANDTEFTKDGATWVYDF